MFRLEKDFEFCASHRLPNHEGKCRRLHGHNWKGRVICEGDELCTIGSSAGMLVDFDLLKESLKGVIEDYLDHHHLNDSLAVFEIVNPTSEEIARWLYRYLKPFIPQLAAVMIEETCTCRVTYRPECTDSSKGSWG